MDQARILFEEAVGRGPGLTRPRWPGSRPYTRCDFRSRPTAASSRSPRATRAARSRPIPSSPSRGSGSDTACVASGGTTRRSHRRTARDGARSRRASSRPISPRSAWSTSGAREEGRAPLPTAVELDPRHGFAWLALGWTPPRSRAGRRRRAGASRRPSRSRARPGMGPTAGVAGLSRRVPAALRGSRASARAACLRGLLAVERSDNMYRDTFRGVSLCALGRTALEQATRTRPTRRSRRRPPICEAGRAHSAAATSWSRRWPGSRERETAPAALDEALVLFERRQGYSFDVMWCCTEGTTLLELSRAAAAAGRDAEAQELRARAVAAGSREATLPA